MGAKQTDKLSFDLRIRTVMEWIMQGYTTADIIRQIVQKWGVSERMAYKYLDKAYKRFVKDEDAKLEAKTAMHVAQRMKIFRDLKFKDQPAGARTALRILDSVAKLQGIVIVKVDHTTAGNPLPADTTHEVIFRDYSKPEDEE